jgi:large subunit ribosomal protein L23
MIDLGLKKKKDGPVKKPSAKKEAKVDAAKAPSSPRGTKNIAWRILASPHVTEKATDSANGGHYAFKVLPSAAKSEIGKAVEDLYGVEVVAVKIVNVPPKRKRMGKRQGWKKGYKKAVVRLKKGQKIEILPR